MGLAGVRSADVDLMRNGLQVGGVNATANTAQMVDFGADRDWPYKICIRKTMGPLTANSAVSLGVNDRTP